MRAFLALKLPKEIKTEIKNIQQQLKIAELQARWVKPEIVHLTLAFLGSITPNKVEPIGKILDEVAREIKPIRLELSQMGCFPNLAKARIVFVDLGGELGKLNALATRIRKQLKKEKIWFDEKPFSAHVTLGRIKKRHPEPRRVRGSPDTELRSSSGQNLTKIIKEVRIKRAEFIADEITFTKSQLTEAGPIYSQLKCVFLA